MPIEAALVKPVVDALMALLSRGISPERVATRGYGKEYPVASNGTSSGRAMNRRVEVTISNDAKPVAPRSSVSG